MNIFSVVMKEKCKEIDMETHFKDAFRAFSKDKEGFYSFTVFIDPIVKIFLRLYSGRRTKVCNGQLARPRNDKSSIFMEKF